MSNSKDTPTNGDYSFCVLGLLLKYLILQTHGCLFTICEGLHICKRVPFFFSFAGMSNLKDTQTMKIYNRGATQATHSNGHVKCGNF